MNVHRSNFSDHILLELSNKSEEKERGQSFWKINDVILLPNKEYIKTETSIWNKMVRHMKVMKS